VDEYKTLFASLGFQLVPAARNWFWSRAHAADGFILDLSGVGVERWIEAIVAGRQPPRTLALAEVESTLQEVLTHWYDDVFIAASPLAAHLGMGNAMAVRAAVHAALSAARLGAAPQTASTFEALERAYIGRSANHERIAEDLAVSRSTFYRLLRRGVHLLAATLVAMHARQD
jgi:hypothetical protein